MMHRLDSIGIAPVRGEWARPNALQKASVRANLTATVSPTLDLSFQSGFIKLDQRLPQVDNNANSFLYNAFTGPGYKNNGVGTLGQPLNGWANATPGDIFQQTNTQGVNRYIGSANVNWRPGAGCRIAPTSASITILARNTTSAAWPSAMTSVRIALVWSGRRARGCSQLHRKSEQHRAVASAGMGRPKVDGRRTVRELCAHSRDGPGKYAAPRRDHAGCRCHAFRRVGDNAPEDRRFLCRGASGAPRSALPHRRDPHRPE